MVKIIEQGYKRITCGKCNSLIEYTQSEVKSGKFNMDYLGDYDVKEYIMCPSCENRVPTKG
jgi:uncharacterized protein YlaI